MKEFDELRQQLVEVVDKTFRSCAHLLWTLNGFLLEATSAEDFEERFKWFEEQLNVAEKALIESGDVIIPLLNEFWTDLKEKPKEREGLKEEMISWISLMTKSFSTIPNMLSSVVQMRESAKKLKEEIQKRK